MSVEGCQFSRSKAHGNSFLAGCSNCSFHSLQQFHVSTRGSKFFAGCSMLLLAGSKNAPFCRKQQCSFWQDALCPLLFERIVLFLVSWAFILSSMVLFSIQISKHKPYLNWKRPRVESKLLKLPHLLWYTPLAGGGANWQWAVDSTLTVLWRFL